MTEFSLQPDQWIGLSGAPARRGRWHASPAFVSSVKPLKTGKGLIALSMAAPLQLDGPLLVDGSFAVRARTESVVVLSAQAGGAACSMGDVLVLEPLTGDWLAQHWPALLRRSFQRASHETAEHATDLIEQIFRGQDGVAATGATVQSFGSKHEKMPAQSVVRPFEKTFSGLDACLVRRGFIPQEMEDKWFIHRHGDEMHFRRSWTGHLVFAVRIQDAPGAVAFDQVTINRHPEQYRSDDVEQDLATLNWLIDQLLLGLPTRFPAGDGETEALKAWSVGGKAILG